MFSNCEQFYKIPGNDKCCDCGSHDPRWASINLGITLCIACSGVHRSLGVHYSKVRSLTLDGWEPEIFKVMMELGNDVINSIFEANYVESDGTDDIVMSNENSTSTSTSNSNVNESHAMPKIRRATSDCDNSIREMWIKAKYVDKLFVQSIDEFKIAKCQNTFQTESNHLNDIIFNESGWLVRRRSKMRSIADKNSVPEKNSTTDDSASGSELSIDSNRAQDDLSFTSDNDSTDEDDDENAAVGRAAEKIEDFNSDLLLYRASILHNLPIMCYALATGASKNWPNQNDLYRTPLHQAVLSVSII